MPQPCTFEPSRRAFLGALAGGLAAQRGLAAPRPNVVFILADDLGWRDTTLYGETFYETPHIERLAARGMRFDQAYAAAPICSPTRASIMTGLYPARLGITTPSGHIPEVVLEKGLASRAKPEDKALSARSVNRLKTEYFTLADAFQEAGYATAHFGKWHLGSEPYDPLHQGFDIDVPHTPAPGPAGGYLGPWKFWPDKGSQGEHIEDRMAKEASRFIRENRGRPFFLNYWAFSVHSPWQAKAELLARYREKASRETGPRKNPVYASMVHSFDEAVGSLTRALEDAGVAKNTIIVLFSDNGGVFWTPGTERAMLHPGFDEQPITSNAPLRGGKATTYEGGTREPCVVVWPGRVRAGARSSTLVSSVDFYPTLLDLAGLPSKEGVRFDGVSFRKALEGKPYERGPVFCHFPHYTPATGNRPSSYVRSGEWKLIRFYADNDDQTDRHELYNLKEDLGETRNLAGARTDKLRELSALLDGFLRDTEAVVPRPNPAYRAK